MAGNVLTPKQEKFAQLVVKLDNAAEAYRQAYDASKSTDSTVYTKASHLMSNGKIAARVRELRDAVADRSLISKERVLKEVSRIAFFDIRKIFNEDGTLKRVIDLDDDTAAAIGSIEAIQIGDDGQLVITKKIKAGDKNPALEKLMKHLGLYELDNKQKTDPVAELLASLKGNITGVAPTGELPGVGLDVPEEDE